VRHRSHRLCLQYPCPYLALKNKILLFSYEDQQQEYYQDEEAAKALIDEIIDFNRNYKRKPKKFRKMPSLGPDCEEKTDGPFLPFTASSQQAYEGQLEDDFDEIRPLMKVEVLFLLSRCSSRSQ
jgi:hypothetical protein